MIKLKQLLNEPTLTESVKMNIGSSKGVTFSIYPNENRLVFIPKTSKDLDLIDNSNFNDIEEILVSYCERMLKGFKFSEDLLYAGAGYSVKLDMDSVIKKLK